MSNDVALAVLEKTPEGDTPTALMRRATDVAGVCREIVMRTAMNLQGKKYVKVEGWMSIAAAYGCFPSIREVVVEEKGVRAVAELRRQDGTVIATAEGFVGMDEPRWASQALYARRGMAQTRAISRVCRSVFAFCVVLIDENLQTTPAEEIPANGEAEIIDAPAVSAQAPTVSAPPPTTGERMKMWNGKHKGKFLDELDDGYLKWLSNALAEDVKANDKKYHASNVQRHEAVKAELARRAGAVKAPAETSPRIAKAEQADLEMEGEDVTPPFARFAALARKYGMDSARLAAKAKHVLGKDSNWTHEDVDTLEGAIKLLPPSWVK